MANLFPQTPMELGGANLHLRPDATYLQSRLEDKVMPAICLVIYGTTYALLIVLPTDDARSITPKRVDAWLRLLHGPFLVQCQGSHAQFTDLLDLFLVYRVFANDLPAAPKLTDDNFYEFLEHLIQALLELHPLEHADDELRELSGWLHVNFAPPVFNVNLVELVAEYTPLTPPTPLLDRALTPSVFVNTNYSLSARLRLMSLEKHATAANATGTLPSAAPPLPTQGLRLYTLRESRVLLPMNILRAPTWTMTSLILFQSQTRGASVVRMKTLCPVSKICGSNH